MENSNTTKITDNKNSTITITWTKTSEITLYSPIMHVVGLCFDKNGNLLVIDEFGKIKIPGGGPEKNESPEQTLIRELEEEANVTVKNIKPLGVQKVEYPNNPNKKEGDLFYQCRYVCLVDELLARSPDPESADGKTVYPRFFLTKEEVLKQFQWGNAGISMFRDAYFEHDKLKKNGFN